MNFDAGALKFRQRFATRGQRAQRGIGRGVCAQRQRLGQERECAHHGDIGLRQALADEPAALAALTGMALELGKRTVHLRATARKPGLVAPLRRTEGALIDLLAGFVGRAAGNRT